MPTFRCTDCARRVESPVVIGAGDCPHCGGDVVFDIHSGSSEAVGEERPSSGVRARLRRWLRR
jgi:hypothetical protein